MMKINRILCLSLLILSAAAQGMNNNALNDQLLDAVKTGNLRKVKTLIAQGADVNAKNNGGWPTLLTPLMNAALNGHEAVCRLLIEKSADINAKDGTGWTALIHATQYGHEAICRLLIESKAAIDAKDKFGRTALTFAANYVEETICTLLIDTMIQRIHNSQAIAITILGLKKTSAQKYTNLIENNVLKLIAKQAHAPAIAQLRSLFAQIDAFEDQETKSRLSEYANRKLHPQQNGWHMGIASCILQ